MRIDLHCHSKYSRRPTLWIMQKLGCPESFTDPVTLYEVMKRKGMGAVTVTDHNVIDACLEIAHLPGTFISEEVTTYFPEDNCKIHVLAYDITEQQHRDIQDLRRSIFDLVDYFKTEGIRHVLAHPFFGVNDRLNMEHVEKLLLLFKTLELNGDQTSYCNDRLKALADHLTPTIMDQLANKHNFEAPFEEPWKKNFTAGSDDHSFLHLGTTSTDVPDTRTLDAFWKGVDAGRARINLRPFSPETMAHNIYGIGYQYYRNLTGLDKLTDKDIFLKYLDRMLRQPPEKDSSLMARMKLRISTKLAKRREGKATKRQKRGQQPTIMELVRREAHKTIREDKALMRLVMRGTGGSAHAEDEWFQFVNEISNKVLLHFGNTLMDRLVRLHVLDVFNCIGSAGALYAVLAPYFVSFAIHGKVRRFSANILRNFDVDDPLRMGANGDTRLAHFTDVFRSGQGVGTVLDRQLAHAKVSDKVYSVVTCMRGEDAKGLDVTNFTPINEHELEANEEQKLTFPPLLDMLKYCYDEEFTHLHAESPGPVGLAAMAIARILKLPISATYHATLPSITQRATADTYMEDLTWKYVLWFYEQMDTIYVPSQATADELIEKGITPEKLRVHERGVDTLQFHPSHRNGILGHSAEDHETNTVKILYAGSVSKERGAHVLAKAFASLAAQRDDVELIVAGEGPYLAEMKKSMESMPCTFLQGALNGQLPEVFASCDLFVNPSTADAYGRAVLEAQASGLPAVVTDSGGPKEHIAAGETGVVVQGNDAEALHKALADLCQDRQRLQAMGEAARARMESRTFELTFDTLWTMVGQETADDTLQDAPMVLQNAVASLKDDLLP